jgi:hypothetical protein
MIVNITKANYLFPIYVSAQEERRSSSMSSIIQLPCLTRNVQTDDCPELPVRADGKIECSRCEELIPVGDGGLVNFRKNHWRKGPCNRGYAIAKEKKATAKGVSFLAGFLKPKAPAIPPTVSSPRPIEIASAPSSLSHYKTHTTTTQSPPALRELERLAASLPSQHSTSTNPFAALSNPEAIAPNLAGDDLWEVLNPLVHGVFGYGMDAKGAVELIEKGGREGVGYFVGFVQHFIERGLVFGLMEGKVDLLAAAMKWM